MVRLDIWLVENDYFSSRQIAKRAIRAGHVLVDGKCAKPSTKVSVESSVTLNGPSRNFPVGYLKLKQIDELVESSLVQKDMMALDVGSSAGGFLAYLAENGAIAIGIEVSKRFRKTLLDLVEDKPSLSLIFDDAFTIDPYSICASFSLDLLLIDVTTDPTGTVTLVERMTPLLKQKGRLVCAVKSRPVPEVLDPLIASLTSLGYNDIISFVLDEERQEFHLLAVRQ